MDRRDRGYGFRARARARPGMTEFWQTSSRRQFNQSPIPLRAAQRIGCRNDKPHRRPAYAVTAPRTPPLPLVADLCTLLCEGVAMPDTVECVEAATHGQGAGRAFGSAIAFPAGASACPRMTSKPSPKSSTPIGRAPRLRRISWRAAIRASVPSTIRPSSSRSSMRRMRWRRRGSWRRTAIAICRSMAFRSPSRITSTCAACRPRRPARPLRTAPPWTRPA